MRFRTIALIALAACDAGKDEPPVRLASGTDTVHASNGASIPEGALTQLPWLLGTFRGTGIEGTAQEPFFERYTLADDSTLIVESFKDSTLAGAVDTSRFEVRRDSLTSVGASRYIATSISPDSINFGPLTGVKNGFIWKKGDSSAWTAVIVPAAATASRRYYRMARIN